MPFLCYGLSRDAPAAKSPPGVRLAAADPIDACVQGPSGLKAQFGQDMQGAVVLVERGGCPFVDKAKAAQAAGAVAVIVFNSGRSGSAFPLLAVPPGREGDGRAVTVPVGSVPWSTGAYLMHMAHVAQELGRELKGLPSPAPTPTPTPAVAASPTPSAGAAASAPVVPAGSGAEGDPPAGPQLSEPAAAAVAAMAAGCPQALSSGGVAAMAEGAPRLVQVGAVDRSAEPYESMAPFSAYGPTTDGRVKPDVVVPGRHVFSALGDNEDKPHCGVESMSGTSMSAALMGGSTALVRQYFRCASSMSLQVWTRPAPRWCVACHVSFPGMRREGRHASATAARNATLGIDPSSALIRAALFNGARPLWGSAEDGTPLEFPPSFRQGRAAEKGIADATTARMPRLTLENPLRTLPGWGRVDLGESLPVGARTGTTRLFVVDGVAVGDQQAADYCVTMPGPPNGSHGVEVDVGGAPAAVRAAVASRLRPIADGSPPWLVPTLDHPLRATLAWTDPPGRVSRGSDPVLVNDLDLSIFTPLSGVPPREPSSWSPPMRYFPFGCVPVPACPGLRCATTPHAPVALAPRPQCRLWQRHAAGQPQQRRAWGGGAAHRGRAVPGAGVGERRGRGVGPGGRGQGVPGEQQRHEVHDQIQARVTARCG